MAGRWSTLSSGLRALRAAGRSIPHLAIDGLGFAGAAAIAYVAWLMYVPAGFPVGGTLAMALLFLFGRKLEIE